MTTPAELQGAMLAESRRLQQLIDAQDDLYNAEADAIMVRDIAEATAYLAATGTVPEREAHVKKACAGERKAAMLATGLRKSNDKAISGAMERLQALRSVAYAQGREAQLARMSDGP